MPIEGWKAKDNPWDRIGKIRLGQKAISQNTGREYPEKSDHFICDDPRFIEVYGMECKELDILLTSDKIDEVAPVYRKRYNLDQVLLCKGTGGEPGDPLMVGDAMVYNPETRQLDIPKKCPCEYAEAKKCTYKMNLMVMLPYVKGVGVWQIDTGGWNSIQSVFDFFESMKRVSPGGHSIFNVMMKRFFETGKTPLKLRLVEKETTIPGTSKPTTIYHLQFEFSDISFSDLFNKEYKEMDIAIQSPETLKRLSVPMTLSEPVSLPEPKHEIVIDTSTLDQECERDLVPTETDNRSVIWTKKTRDAVVGILDAKERSPAQKEVLLEWERVVEYCRKNHLESPEYIPYETLGQIREGKLEGGTQ